MHVIYTFGDELGQSSGGARTSAELTEVAEHYAEIELRGGGVPLLRVEPPHPVVRHRARPCACARRPRGPGAFRPLTGLGVPPADGLRLAGTGDESNWGPESPAGFDCATTSPRRPSFGSRGLPRMPPCRLMTTVDGPAGQRKTGRGEAGWTGNWAQSGPPVIQQAPVDGRPVPPGVPPGRGTRSAPRARSLSPAGLPAAQPAQPAGRRAAAPSPAWPSAAAGAPPADASRAAP